MQFNTGQDYIVGQLFASSSMDKATLPATRYARPSCVELFRSTAEATLPSGLQSLGFGRDLNRNMEKGALPSGLLLLTFGLNFPGNVDGRFSSCPQSSTFGADFSRARRRRLYPVVSRQSPAPGADLNQCTMKATLFWCLQISASTLASTLLQHSLCSPCRVA